MVCAAIGDNDDDAGDDDAQRRVSPLAVTHDMHFIAICLLKQDSALWVWRPIPASLSLRFLYTCMYVWLMANKRENSSLCCTYSTFVIQINLIQFINSASNIAFRVIAMAYGAAYCSRLIVFVFYIVLDLLNSFLTLFIFPMKTIDDLP